MHVIQAGKVEEYTQRTGENEDKEVRLLGNLQMDCSCNISEYMLLMRTPQKGRSGQVANFITTRALLLRDDDRAGLNLSTIEL